jgi:hypothetical protein
MRESNRQSSTIFWATLPFSVLRVLRSIFSILFTTMTQVHYTIIILFLSGCNALIPPLTQTTLNNIIKSPRIPPKTTLFQLPQKQQTQANPEQQQQPFLARAYSRALRVAIRLGTLFGPIDGLVVHCEATSNRNVVLGRISSLRIDFGRLSSPFLKTRDFQFIGNDLELGFGPLLLLLTPFLILWRRKVLSLMLCLVLAPRLLKRKQEKISVATYRLGLSGEDLSSPNTLLRIAIHRAMDHLLRNSVVGILAGSALAVAKVQSTTTNLKVMAQEDQMAQLASALDDNSTKVMLKRVTIGENGRLLVNAVATFPDPSSGTTSQLDFVVRLTLSPIDEDLMKIATAAANAINNKQQQDRLTLQPNGCGIMVANAELKASFDTLGGPLEIFGKPIPDLWIPVVSGGLAYSFGSRHRVLSVESIPSQDRLDVCGAIYFNGDAPMLKKNAFGIWKTPFSGPSLPPPRRPALPGR